MARNEEKARVRRPFPSPLTRPQGSLNRWTMASREGGLKPAPSFQRRPQLASECTNLNECERWRRQLLDELNRKVMQINGLNVATDRDKIMELNDSCNRVLRILEHWERQIRALGWFVSVGSASDAAGGPDYRSGPNTARNQGVEAEAGKYLYFGITKNLPEVKEVLSRRSESLAKSAVETISKKKVDPRLLDHEYYGFNDDDLTAAETLAEDKARKRAMEEFLPPKKKGVEDDDDGEAALWEESWTVPDRQAVDAALLDLRKRQILEKYAGATA